METAVDRGMPAPIDASLLEPVLGPRASARTLPGEAYTSHDVFEWERRRFFEGSWICLGHVSSLPALGSQFATRVGDESILLVRERDATLRGFFNVCRHRGHELLACGDMSDRHAITCPYHGWVYGLDGVLRAAPRFPDLAPDDPVHDGLVPVPVREWLGWVFVNASADAPPFELHIGTLGELIGPYRPDRLVVGATQRYEIAANWKLIVENYHECYHCPSIHPELCRVTPPESGENLEPTGLWAGGSMDLQAHAETMSISGRSEGATLHGLNGWHRRHVFYFGLFPNLLISPHPDYVMTHRIEPVAPGRSLIECQWLFDPEVSDRPGFDPGYAVEFWDITNTQDWKACESLQRGAASRGYRPGPLAPEESAVRHFLQMVALGYLTGTPSHPPPSAGPGRGEHAFPSRLRNRGTRAMNAVD
jgi:glycine betaine catabolism A